MRTFSAIPQSTDAAVNKLLFLLFKQRTYFYSSHATFLT